jgi:phenylacetyl-CoA:acceptor oxidoreductase subunit 2
MLMSAMSACTAGLGRAGGDAGAAAAVFAGRALVVAGGWMLKYTLVRRAAFTQGLALERLPVRGGGPAGPRRQTGLEAVMRGHKSHNRQGSKQQMGS